MKPVFINLTTIEDRNAFVNITNCSDMIENRDYTSIQFIRHSVYVKESLSKIKELINEAYLKA